MVSVAPLYTDVPHSQVYYYFNALLHNKCSIYLRQQSARAFQYLPAFAGDVGGYMDLRGIDTVRASSGYYF